MFFVDKYSPTTTENAYFHKELLAKLKIMSNDDSVPHLIFYGPAGSGKKTIIRLFLEMLYDKEVLKTKDTTYTVIGSGNSPTEVAIKQSNYHIVIDPNNNNFDRYLIQDVVKEYAKRMPLGVFTTNKVFKTVLIQNIDFLSYYAQTSLRRTMEKYSGTCRFVMWSRSLSKVIEPLRSRCICIKVQSPTDSDLFGRIYEISMLEKMKLTLQDFTELLDKSRGNIKKALWYLELYKFKMMDVNTYDETIIEICKLLCTCQIKSVLTIRELMYKIMITNVDGTQIIKDIIINICKDTNIPNDAKYNIINFASKYEHNLIRGRREIIHLEGFILSTMKTLSEKMVPIKIEPLKIELELATEDV
jgi:replication factor C subunit 3/5